MAEHRANRLRALLDAGREIVATEGAEALTLASLARRVGLSRPSLYEYFRSREELVAVGAVHQAAREGAEERVLRMTPASRESCLGRVTRDASPSRDPTHLNVPCCRRV